MNKKKLLTFVGSLALVGAIGIGATLAYFTDKDTATNVVNMGHVDITLTEPVFSRMYVDNTIKGVVPNQSIYKDPLITLDSESKPAYIRAKIEYEGNIFDNEPGKKEELENGIKINSTYWVLGDDGYYYYQNTLQPGDEVYFFKEVTIPSNWENEVADSKFEINITAEAIQANNFDPQIVDGRIVGWNGETAETYNVQ